MKKLTSIKEWKSCSRLNTVFLLLLIKLTYCLVNITIGIYTEFRKCPFFLSLFLPDNGQLLYKLLCYLLVPNMCFLNYKNVILKIPGEKQSIKFSLYQQCFQYVACSTIIPLQISCQWSIPKDINKANIRITDRFFY